jgi:hypothetical protein
MCTYQVPEGYIQRIPLYVPPRSKSAFSFYYILPLSSCAKSTDPHSSKPQFRFRRRRLFEHDISCDIYSGVERRLTGPGNNPGI